ncbi:hypothetical protein [Thiolapillus sp.]|nr:hypothetical protein [Thiolapillus sp.]
MCDDLWVIGRSSSLRFALHGWQRVYLEHPEDMNKRLIELDDNHC